MEIRIAVVNDSSYIEPCGYDVPICPNPGLHVELTLYILKSLITQTVSQNLTITMVPLETYDDDGPNSMFGSLAENTSDVTLAYMAMQPERASLVQYLPMMYTNTFALVYKSLSVGEPNLGLFTASQWYVWAFALAVGMTGLVIKFIRKRCCHDDHFWKQYVTRQSVVLAFFFGIFLRYISTQLVLLFYEIDQIEEPFTNAEELIDKLESHEYSALAAYHIPMDKLLNPTKFAGESKLYDRYIAAHKHNPSKLMPTLDEAMHLLMNSSETKYVLVTAGMDITYLKSKYCDITIQIDNFLPTQLITMFVRPGLQLDLMHFAPNLIEIEYRRLSQKYYPVFCSHQTRKVNEPEPLDITQIQSVFWLLVIASVTGTALLVWENLRIFIR